MSNNNERRCLFCNLNIPKNGLINHIAEHINYKRHRCRKCTFKSVLVETMVDHQNQTGHKIEIDASKNWYFERVCQMIYCDFDYAEKHGEDSIRELGSVFADRDRLMEMLRTDDVKEENLEIEYIDTDAAINRQSKPEEQRTESSGIQQARCRSDSILEFDEDLEVETEQTFNLTQNRSSILQKTELRDHQKSMNLRNDPEVQLSRRTTNVQTAPADSSISDLSFEEGKTTTVRLLAELHMQITRGIEKRKCKMCTQHVDNDYSSQKRHVLEKHMVSVPLHERTIRYTGILERCFKQDGYMFVTNDYQCNVCGREFKYRGGRYRHVASCHTDYRWACVFTGCDFEAPSFAHFIVHMNQVHGKKSYELEEEEKDRYVRMKAEYELKLTPLVRKCFPFDLPSSGKGADDDALIDETPCNFMPTREIPQQLTPRIVPITASNHSKQSENESSGTSDLSSDEDIKPIIGKSLQKYKSQQQLGKSSATSKTPTIAPDINRKANNLAHKSDSIRPINKMESPMQKRLRVERIRSNDRFFFQ